MAPAHEPLRLRELCYRLGHFAPREVKFRLSTDVKTAPVAASKATDAGLVKGLGLVSSTTLVMGSMIGSGIFIVSADIARLTDSPALLIAAWALTGFLTIVGA